MTDLVAPACLSFIDHELIAPGLMRSCCRYQPEQFDDDSFTVAGIQAPPSVSDAALKRKTEYLAGRWCAREGLKHLGFNGTPQQQADRSPRWPDGSVGSITHSHGVAEALVADKKKWRAVGIDSEVWLDPERADRLCHQLLTRSEYESLAGQDPLSRARRISEIFSAKESLFKALYPLTGKRFYFHDAETDKEGNITLLIDLSASWTAGTGLAVTYLPGNSHIMTRICLPA
ncbi:MAG: 4'-phosphopantetheinyl transferase superfamily protein [Thiohalomonadales bacterium]|nr:4'-phosphopantetheinyl transferase superfamily protein [Thiohalomonadales bacterium]